MQALNQKQIYLIIKFFANEVDEQTLMLMLLLCFALLDCAKPTGYSI